MLATLKTAVRQCSATLLCMDKAGSPLQRLWCLWEMDCTVAAKVVL